MKYPRKLEIVLIDIYEGIYYLCRLKVPGGWIVTEESGPEKHGPFATSMCFVPDPNHEWELEDEREPK